MNRYRGSRDRNHDAVRSTFEGAGCSVADMALAGVPGFPDMLVGVLGESHLVEVKNRDTAYGRSGLNRDQSAFARDWRGSPVWLCHGPDEALVLVAQWRARWRVKL